MKPIHNYAFRREKPPTIGPSAQLGGSKFTGGIMGKIPTTPIDMKLEVEIIPVSDVDRSKQFYQRLGWRLDDDVAPLDPK